MKQALGGKLELFSAARQSGCEWMYFCGSSSVFPASVCPVLLVQLLHEAASEEEVCCLLFSSLLFPLCFLLCLFSTSAAGSLHTWPRLLAPGTHWVQLIVTGWGLVTYIEPLWPKGHFTFHWVHTALKETLKQVSIYPLIKLWRCCSDS